ncbi:hypothetical protein BLNAU_3832 [Blattamonas nauphoetae]|uniref:Uncharacterized protein n=1 Tax=Blattamonas nauphoetae TaxID=2049346 RepID=A0ABQ9YBF8_9EUKA|nr:hypothetical protein BLNAU_3832 [Blattamonas nauphoetae]
MLTLLLVGNLITHSELLQDNSPHDNVLPPTLQTSGDFLEQQNSKNQPPRPPVTANYYASSRHPSSSGTVLDGRRQNLQSRVSSVLVESFDNARTQNSQPYFNSIETFYDHSHEVITIVLKGSNVIEGFYTLSLENDVLTSTSNVVDMEEGTVSFQFQIHYSSLAALIYGHTYFVASVDLEGSDATTDRLSFTVESPPMCTGIDFKYRSEMNLSIVIVLDGQNFEPGTVHIAKFNNSISVEVTMDSEEQGTSEEILIGTSDGFMFGATYTLTSITPVGDAIQIRLYDLNDVTTRRKPAQIELLLGTSSSSDPSESCGDRNRPCSTIDQAWAIVMQTLIQTVRLTINSPTKQIVPIEIGRNQQVFLHRGISPKLVLPSSASMKDEDGMIVVHDASFEIEGVGTSGLSGPKSFLAQKVHPCQGVYVEIESPSLVFIYALSSSVIFKDSSVRGPSSSATNEDDSLCAWDTGAVHLVNSTTQIIATPFSNLPLGAINMEAGNLTIEASTFTYNGPNHTAFPSAHRNIHCSEDGEIEIVSLYGGDGTSDSNPHLWFSANDCSLEGDDEVNVDAPFFVPTFDLMTSKAELDKKKKQNFITIGGKTLIPCGLFLEVFEESKKKPNGKSIPFELTLESCKSFSETKIEFVLSQSALTTLDIQQELRFRLGFGHEQRTQSSAVLSLSAKERFANDGKRQLAWAIPVAIVGTLAIVGGVVVILLVCRRRSKNKAQTDDPKENNEMEKEEEKATQRE